MILCEWCGDISRTGGPLHGMEDVCSGCLEEHAVDSGAGRCYFCNDVSVSFPNKIGSYAVEG